MSGAPARGTVPRRQKRHHHHHHHHHHHRHQHQKHQRRQREEPTDEPEEKRPKVNPIFLWASQREQRIVEVRCEDYDKRNRIKLTKTAHGWRSIPRTASNIYSTSLAVLSQEKKSTSVGPSAASGTSGDDNAQDNQSEHLSVSTDQRGSKNDRVNGRTNEVPAEGRGRKRKRYDELEENSKKIRDYNVYPLENLRNGARIVTNWQTRPRQRHRKKVLCSEDDEEEEDYEEEENHNEQRGPYEEERRPPERETEKEDSYEVKEKNDNCSTIEKLRKDKLYQPRVVLEHLPLSQLPENVHPNPQEQDGKNDEDERREEEQDEDEGIGDEEELEAADTPNDVDVGKRFDLASKETSYKRLKASSSSTLSSDEIKNRRQADSCYENQNLAEEESSAIVDKLEVHDEKIHETFVGDSNAEENALSCKESLKAAEADGGLGNRQKNTPSEGKWPSSGAADENLLEAEEEAPDEPGEPLKLDYNDSSKILNALRNTPGLLVSVTRTRTPENAKNYGTASTRPSSKASSSSRSPDSQTECIERLLKSSSADSAGTGEEQERRSPRANLPGLSIVIPSYRYRSSVKNASVASTQPTSPAVKQRVESPESTVNFPRNEIYNREAKLNAFAEDEEEQEIEEEDEDDCDSQVLEDLRRQNADSMVCGNLHGDVVHGSNSAGSQDDAKVSAETGKRQDVPAPLWINCNRNSEAQAKCRYQDLEHFDEQVLEELRTRGTVVSPQPSGIPCSPASRRPSSAYLERLLPSPPCSVSCSEDAKNDLTLKGILSSPSCLDARDQDRPRETSVVRCEQTLNLSARFNEPSKEFAERTNGGRRAGRAVQERVNTQNQELRSSGRPMSSGDIHSTHFTSDRSAPKRPMSAEYTINRQKVQTPMERYPPDLSVVYQRPPVRSKMSYSLDQQETCATSSSTDKILDPASQLRELLDTHGHLIPDPLLVPRSYLPALAAAPAMEIPKLLASRPELRLPEALTRPDLLRDPDLLVISLAHLQHVLDHGEGPVSRSRQPPPRGSNAGVKGTSSPINGGMRNGPQMRPKLSCKPIGTLMPGPIDLSSNRKASPYPPLLRVRSGLLKQESEVSSTANSPDDSQLWHPLFGSQKRQPQHPPTTQHQHASWHRTTLAS